MQALPNDNLLHHVEEVKTVYTKDEVNQLLKEGWTLLAVGSGQKQTSQHDYEPIFGYCLGKVKTQKV